MITIIVLLILAGITISQIASQDSAPNKAAEAKVENDKGAMKDTANLVTTKYGLSTLFCTIFIRTLLNFRICDLHCKIYSFTKAIISHTVNNHLFQL